MLYTLALSRVNTRLVFRSRPRRPSRIAALGALDKDRSSVDICRYGRGGLVCDVLGRTEEREREEQTDSVQVPE